MPPARSLPLWPALALLLGAGGCRKHAPPTQPPTPPADPASTDAASSAAAPDLELRLARNYACLREGTEVMCWGKRVVVPDGSTADPQKRMTTPVHAVERFAVGSDRICVIAGGSLLCWGHDMDETPELTEDADPIIERLDLPAPVTDVRIDDTTVCALDGTKALTCWTYQEPPDYDEYEDDHEPEPPWMERHELPPEIVTFDVGDAFACGIRSGGTIECWGEDPYHADVAERDWDACTDQIDWSMCEDEDEDEDEDAEGDCDYEERECDIAYDEQLAEGWLEGAPVRGIPRPTAIAAGDSSACALTEKGEVYCWGYGDRGQLGHGAQSASIAPVRVLDIDDAVALDVGASHACVVHRSGRVSCWGNNKSSTVGGPRALESRPRPVPGIDDAVGLVLHDTLSCAIVRDGPPRCWGQDTAERFVDSTPASSIPAVKVDGITRLMPFGRDTCAAREDGSMVCWGQLELDSKQSVAAYAEPRPSAHRDLVQLIHKGPCARTSAGDLRCWKSAAEMNQRGPTTKVVSEVVAADAGTKHICAVARDGQVHCWLASTSKGKPPSPSPASAVTTAVDVAVGKDKACAVRRDGKVECWQLDAHLSRPAQRLHRAEDVTRIVDGDDHVCVRTSKGQVRCWQWDALDKPPFDQPLEAVEALAAGDRHFCALTRGQVWCWGRNNYGQLGPQAEGSRSAGPVQVQGLPEVIDLAAGESHTCARTRAGTVHCWGRAEEGQLGRMPPSHRSTPTPLYPAPTKSSEVAGSR